MRHRHEDQHGDRQRHPGERHLRPHYAARRDEDALDDGLPAVLNRKWEPSTITSPAGMRRSLIRCIRQ